MHLMEGLVHNRTRGKAGLFQREGCGFLFTIRLKDRPTGLKRRYA